MFNTLKHHLRWLSAVGFLFVLCAFALSSSSAPTALAAGSVAFEFNGSNLDPALTFYAPRAGAGYSLTVDPGYLRMILPSFSTFDHWTNNDTAPQLRAVAPNGDWEITTRLRVLIPAPSGGYQAGLMVYFSKQDLLYWGPYQGKEIRLERSGLRPGVSAQTPLARAGNDVELQIAKQGANYAFSYRAAGSDAWQLVGNYTATQTPQFVGLITKAWWRVHLEVNFDYLHINEASNTVVVSDRGQSSAASSVCDFADSTLDPMFSTYIPKAGPGFSLSANPGHLRMSLPSSSGFDHWTNNDTAPQLRAVAPSGDWEISTRLRVLTPASTASYQAGLMVYFSKQDLLYWGPYQGQEIRLERSGLRPGVSAQTPLARAGNDVELQIAKQGTTYAFSYRAAGSDAWQLVGSYATPETPQFVGLIIKAWQNLRLEVDFDYLHLPGCQQ